MYEWQRELQGGMFSLTKDIKKDLTSMEEADQWWEEHEAGLPQGTYQLISKKNPTKPLRVETIE